MELNEVWKAPFRYECGYIFDANSKMVANMRGWGYLTGKGQALGLPPDEASKLQDAMGERIARLLSGETE